MAEAALSQAFVHLIDALAAKCVRSYLHPEAAPDMAAEDTRTNPVPLPASDRAA